MGLLRGLLMGLMMGSLRGKLVTVLPGAKRHVWVTLGAGASVGMGSARSAKGTPGERGGASGEGRSVGGGDGAVSGGRRPVSRGDGAVSERSAGSAGNAGLTKGCTWSH